MDAQQVYETIEKRALPVIKNYQTDLTKIDRDLIENNPDISFLHFTGPHGTSMIFFPKHNSFAYPKKGEMVPYFFSMADRVHIVRGKKDWFDAIMQSDMKTLILFYDNKSGRIKEYSEQDASDYINGYIAGVLETWEQEGR